jgi:hypothetical protein
VAKKPTTADLVAPTTPEDIEAIRRQRDELNAQLRKLNRKAAPAKQLPSLAEVEARQAEEPAFYAMDVLAPLAAQRVKAGDSVEHAVTALLEVYAPLLVKAVQVHDETGASWDDSIAAVLGRERKPRPTKAVQ